MSEPGEKQQEPVGTGERRFWLLLLFSLCLWVAWRMGAFDLTTTVSIDGRQVKVPNVYAWVDHPFHATRAHVLLDTLRQGDIPRWIGNHQGGYPVEFYPLGVAWIDVAFWALLLGAVPIVAVHKLVVIAVFLLPALSYWILVRGDRIHPGIAVLATAVHFSVPGHWLNGGYTELVGWGLVTNVAGGSLALLATASLARFVMNREQRMGVLAVLAAAGGACTNPRSLFAVVIASLAIVFVTTLRGEGQDRRARFVNSSVRVVMVGSLAALLAAPVILALFRYNAEYFFLHYEFYDPLSEFWTASATAVSLPVVVLAIAGVALVLVVQRFSISQAMAATLVLYALFTVLVATSGWVPPLVEQLEAPRLMPFQRQLMIYTAALAVGAVLQALSRWVPLWERARGSSVAYGLIALAMLLVFVRPAWFVPDGFQGLTPVGTTGTADLALFTDAIDRAEKERTQGSSIFVVGNRDDWWHQQLWAPVASDAPFYYDDWMWYWTRTHKGPYDYRNGHYFPNPSEALTTEYFGDNGISVLVVTDMWVPSGPSPRQAARSNDALQFVETVGQWDIYRVLKPTAIVTNGDSLPEQTRVGNEEINATFANGDGRVVIRRNWFPRWEAFVNGEKVKITYRSDGYMEITAPSGPVEIELRYGVTALDWVARVASITGFIGTVVFVLRGNALLSRVGQREGIAPQ